MSPSKRPTVGKFWMPAKPSVRSSSRKSLRDDERIGAVDAGEDRRLLHDREHLVGHLLDDLVGVAVREETRGAAAAGHPVAARVVDDQQVDAARLLAHGGEPGAGAAADDRLAARDLLAESLQNALPGIVHAHESFQCLS